MFVETEEDIYFWEISSESRREMDLGFALCLAGTSSMCRKSR